MEAPGWPAHQQFPTCIPPPPLKKKSIKSRKQNVSQSASTALPLHVASGELFLFILPTSKLGKVQLGNTFESKNELCLLQSFLFSGLRQYVLFWGWVAAHGKLTVYWTGEKSRPSKEKERQASHYQRRQPQSPEGRKLEQVLLCAMGIKSSDVVTVEFYVLSIHIYVYVCLCVYVYMCSPLNKPVLHETGWLKGRSRRNMSYLSNEKEIMGI